MASSSAEGLKQASLLSEAVAFLLVLLLAALVTSWRNILGPYLSPIAWILTGLAIGGLSWQQLAKRQKMPSKQPRTAVDFLPLLVFAVGVGLTAWKFSSILPHYPIDPEISDVIPALKQYVGRFLAGEEVYAPMQLSTWTIYPNYMPLRWLIFTPAEWLGIDYRWWAQLMLYSALLPWYFYLVWSDRSFLSKLLFSLNPVIVLAILMWGDPPFWGMMVEQMYTAFYLILAYGLLKRSPFLIGLGVLLCLLSRFSFSFWLPAFGLVYIFRAGLGRNLITGGVLTVGILVFLVIPFLSKDWNMFSKSMDYYDTAILDQWKVQPWQQPGEVPYYMNNGLSFTYYFYSLAEGDIRERLDLAKVSLVLASLFAALGIMLLYLLFFRKKDRWHAFWLIGLAVFLTVFYSFMYMPFPYLFMIPVLIWSVLTFTLQANIKQGSSKLITK